MADAFRDWPLLSPSHRYSPSQPPKALENVAAKMPYSEAAWMSIVGFIGDLMTKASPSCGSLCRPFSDHVTSIAPIGTRYVRVDIIRRDDCSRPYFPSPGIVY